MSKTINIIAAVDEAFGFGKDGKIPWHYPEDFKFFQKMTKGNTVIMGRKTFDDLLTYTKNDNFLPNRECIVITSTPLPFELNYSDGHRGITLEANSDRPYQNVHRASTISYALDKSRNLQGDVFFIGGEGIFDAGLNMADCVYITVVPGNHGCDRFFPAEKLREKFHLYNTERSGELTFTTYVHNIWGKGNPAN